jgi:hypothetical protein
VRSRYGEGWAGHRVTTREAISVIKTRNDEELMPGDYTR